MESEYILIISVGGVFALLLAVYTIVSLQEYKTFYRSQKNLKQSYSDGNLRKMEYDVAFYDKKTITAMMMKNGTERQVTIDDVLAENSVDAAQLSAKAVFTQVEDEGVEEIRGKFNPEI